MNEQPVQQQRPKGDARAQEVAPPPAPTQATAQQAMPPLVKPKALSEHRIKLSHAAERDIGNIWYATVTNDLTFEDCCHDEVWANKARDFRAGDTIVVYPDSMDWCGELRVRKTWSFGASAINNRAAVGKWKYVFWGPVEEHTRVGEFEIVNLGPHLKWCLRRLDNKKVVAEGYATQDDAVRARQGIMASRAA
jgi:hypothetical protein